MKNIWIVLLIFLLLFAFSSFVLAHPGRTDSSGCHTCHTNCPSWGLSYGEYHCHNDGGGSNNTMTVQSESTIVNPTDTPYIPRTTNTPKPTETPIPTITPTPSPTHMPTPTRTIMRKVKKTTKPKITKQQTSFWSWLFGK